MNNSILFSVCPDCDGEKIQINVQCKPIKKKTCSKCGGEKVIFIYSMPETEAIPTG